MSGLSPRQRDRLSRLHEGGPDRYAFYLRRGLYTEDEAYRYALAWARNARDQRRRRLGHRTGATGWT